MNAILLFTLLNTSIYAQDIDLVYFTENSIQSETNIKVQANIQDNPQDITEIKVQLNREGNFHQSLEVPKFTLDCDKGIAHTKFYNKWFEIRRSYLYEIEASIECNKTNIISFDEKSHPGQVLKIFHLAQTALKRMKNLNIVSFWKNRITLKYPSNGDYYNWDTVNLTKGYQWDVVGHEIGHAIYDQADVGVMGGGRHKIDECYTNALALSEGWASFFAAWLSIELTDNDAKFTYMVPRRAPIQIENIPSDVCTGPKNEWRVAGFLWDLIDHNKDDENTAIEFKELWNLTLKKRFTSITELARSLKNHVDPVLINVVYQNNFIEDLR